MLVQITRSDKTLAIVVRWSDERLIVDGFTCQAILNPCAFAA